MFGSLGFPELMLIFVIALIVFGPRKLPDIGRSLGRALGEFKKATTEMRMTLEEEVRLEEQKKHVAETVSAIGTAAPPANTVAVAPPVVPAAPPAAAETAVATPAADVPPAGSTLS